MDVKHSLQLRVSNLEWTRPEALDMWNDPKEEFGFDPYGLVKLNVFLQPSANELPYAVTPEVALRAFHSIADVGDLCRNVPDESWFVAWREFVHRYGYPINMPSHDDVTDTVDFQTGKSSKVTWHLVATINGLNQMPLVASTCRRLAEFIKEDDIGAIKDLCIWRVNTVTFGTQIMAPGDAGLTIYRYPLLRNEMNRSSWKELARRWIAESVTFLMGPLEASTDRSNQFIVKPLGLQGAMWLAFFNNEYPQPIQKLCRGCERPMETDNPRTRICPDCKRRKNTEKQRRKRARKHEQVV